MTYDQVEEAYRMALKYKGNACPGSLFEANELDPEDQGRDEDVIDLADKLHHAMSKVEVK